MGGNNRADFPSSGQRIHEPPGVAQESLSPAKWQLIDRTGYESVSDIFVGQSVIRLGIIVVLRARLVADVAALKIQVLCKGIRNDGLETVGKPLIDLPVDRFIVGVSLVVVVLERAEIGKRPPGLQVSKPGLRLIPKVMLIVEMDAAVSHVGNLRAPVFCQLRLQTQAPFINLRRSIKRSWA